jgi:hypothetical protein
MTIDFGLFFHSCTSLMCCLLPAVSCFCLMLTQIEVVTFYISLFICTVIVFLCFCVCVRFVRLLQSLSIISIAMKLNMATTSVF